MCDAPHCFLSSAIGYMCAQADGHLAGVGSSVVRGWPVGKSERSVSLLTRRPPGGHWLI